jgi:hypothetical protein
MISFRRFVFAAALAVAAILALCPCAALAQLTPEERQLNLDSFEFVWIRHSAAWTGEPCTTSCAPKWSRRTIRGKPGAS